MSGLRIPVTKTDHILGSPHAGVILVEYGDYECSYCGLAFPVTKRIQASFGERLRFVFRHFPLTEVHPLAEGAAEAAEFAGTHGKFWEMHDQLYQHQDELGTPLYLAAAVSLGLDGAGMRAALAGQTYSSVIEGDFNGGVCNGVNGTPAFFINGQRHDGSYEYEELRAAIEVQLAMA